MNRFQNYMAKRQSPMADAAIALGVPVFACGSTKAPLTPNGFKDATTDPTVIRAMFANPAAVMIGMPTGDATGIVVIDVDVKDGAQGGAWLGANSHRMPQTRTIRTGSGGLHIYLVMPPGVNIRNSASKIAPGIDVRGNGGYVIVQPSPGYAVADNAPVAEVPDWLMPALVPIERPVQEYRAPVNRTTTEGGTAYGLAALDDECRAISGAFDGAKHATLNKAAYAIGGLVAAGELERGVAFASLSAALNDIRGACKDFRAAERTLRNSFNDGMNKPRDVPEREIETIEIHPAAQFLAKLHERANREAAKPLPVAPGLLDVDGALKLFLDHCQATAISPQPFLALAAGICAVGALAGRKYRTRTNLRTNIYAVGIADSGGGKDHARKRIKAVFNTAGLTRYLGGEDVASGAAMLTALNRHPAVLFQIDEFGDWLGNVLGKNASPHKKAIAEKLKALYSSADSFIAGTEYANQSKKDGREREDIQQPHACLYGTTTPGQFWTAIASASMHDGFMARVLICVSENSYPDEADPDYAEPPADLVAAFQAIANGAEANGTGNLTGLTVMAASDEMDAYCVDASPDAEAAIKAVRKEQLAMQRKAGGTYVTAIAARWAENTTKLALIRAVSRDPAWPTINAADVSWGRAFAKHCMDTLLQDADRYVAENEFERRINKAMEIIRKHGPITQRDLIRKGFKLSERERTEVLKTLVDSGMVMAIAIEHESGGRPTVKYQAMTEGGSE